MPKILLKRLHDVNPSETRFFTDPGSFIMGAQTLPENSRAVLTRTYPSDAALAKALETNQVAPEIKAILYDNESWSFTPSEEQHDLDRFEKLAADAVHRSGACSSPPRPPTSCPSSIPKSSAANATMNLRLGIARMAARWEAAAAQAREANPRVRIFAGLSTNPSGKPVTGKQLYGAVQATRDDVEGYWLNIPGGGAYCPKCGQPQPQVHFSRNARFGDAVPARD